MGVYALVVGNVTYPLLVCFLNGRSVTKYLGYKQEITRSFCVPFLAAVVMGVVTFLVYTGLHMVTGSNLISLLPSILVAVFVYFVLVLKLKGLSRDELYEFPMGRRLSIIADKLHLL